MVGRSSALRQDEIDRITVALGRRVSAVQMDHRRNGQPVAVGDADLFAASSLDGRTGQQAVVRHDLASAVRAGSRRRRPVARSRTSSVRLVRDVARLTGGTANGTVNRFGSGNPLGSNCAVWSAEALRPQPAAPSTDAPAKPLKAPASTVRRLILIAGPRWSAARTGRTPAGATPAGRAGQRPDRQQHAGRHHEHTERDVHGEDPGVPHCGLDDLRDQQQPAADRYDDPAAGHGVPDARRGEQKADQDHRRRAGAVDAEPAVQAAEVLADRQGLADQDRGMQQGEHAEQAEPEAEGAASRRPGRRDRRRCRGRGSEPSSCRRRYK